LSKKNNANIIRPNIFIGFKLTNLQLCKHNMKIFCVAGISIEKKWKMSLRAYTSNLFEVRSIVCGDGTLG